MAWIDYKKAYDSVPHSWIIESLELIGVADNVKALLEKSMSLWRTTLTSNGKMLGEVEFKRGIFQGDSLSPLLFVIALIPLTDILRNTQAGYKISKSEEKINHLLFMDDLKLYSKNEKELDSLVQTVRIFSDDIGMDFGISKCAVLVMNRGKKIKSDGIALPDGRKLRSLEENDDCYKYLGVLEADDVLHLEMKEKLRVEYKRRLRKLLKSKLNGGNLMKAINTWAVSSIRYSGGIVNWTKNDLQEMDRKTRKLLCMYGALHPRSCVNRIYLPRTEGGRGLISIEDCIRMEEGSLAQYIKNSQERLLIAACKIGKHAPAEQPKDYKERKRDQRWEEIMTKPLQRQYHQQIKDVADKETWNWVRVGDLKRETEVLIIAAQDQAIRTNAIKAKIENQEVSEKCRMCGTCEETVEHIICACSKLAQIEYKRRHDTLARLLHWELCKKYGLPCCDKWYEHDPDSVMENHKVKLLWDFTIQTDRVIQARRPDIVLVEKELNKTWIIDVAVPADRRIEIKELEKIEKYQDLARELKKIWKTKVKVVPVVVGSLGSVSKRLKKYVTMLGISNRITTLQKSAILGTARILRKVLEL